MKKVYQPKGQVSFNPEVDVTQEYVDKEVERVSKMKQNGQKLEGLDMDLYLASISAKKEGRAVTPYHYCYMRDL